MAALLMLTGPLAGRRFSLGVETVVGRSPSCEIALEDSRVSRRHVRVAVAGAQVQLEDLGSRNGTLVNGERITGTVALTAGDEIQIGTTTALFDPPTKASFSDRAVEIISSVPIEEVLPRVGSEATLYSLSVALLSATSEAMVLRRAAEELARALGAEQAAALLGEFEGTLTASVVGATTVEVPRALARAALQTKELSAGHTELCAPLVPAGGQPLGLLYAKRDEPFLAEERSLAATLGRMAGESLAAVRLRSGRGLVQQVLVGASKSFRKALEDARRAALSETPVFISGERGTGRTAFARSIHALSRRAVGPWIEFDCRRELTELEADLRGQPGGAGSPPRPSAVLRADGGTLYLRQVEVLPRALTEGLVSYLSKKVAPGIRGGEESVDVRIVASGAHPLASLLDREQIDAGLAQCLHGNEISLAPLRSRSHDIPALFDHFATEAVRDFQMTAPTLSPESRRLLTDYGWPANVKELALIAQRLAIVYPGMEITALRLPLEVQQGSSARPRSLSDLVSAVEREAISEALREAKGKKIRAAEILGISRPTLDKKIEEYKLTVPKQRSSVASA